MAWAHGLSAALQPHAGAGAYANFMTGDEAERVGPAYATAYGRLVELKETYDPTNFFRIKQNIVPV